MRGGVRLPAVIAVIITLGLLTGCSDPAGAVRRERSAARKASPSPRVGATSPKPQRHTPVWWQAPGHVKKANGLRVRTGALREGQMKVAITDVGSRTRHILTATTIPHGATVGHFTLTGIKVARSPKSGKYGVTFHYH